ncbi:hypothetical protein HYDPIDRAFT_107637 [Hydnomerulius pinastri MD-312]|nr:hypothetical protein HYDPIDRAFT_107637 [Hydnomerulius pinastri MD-312]
MASSSVRDELKRIKVTVDRAANDPDRGGHTRRAAFSALIELAHSPHPSLKSYAAGHIQVFFDDFPDLEEDAINAVYDLCEDQDPKVRLDGYNAVTQVSDVQRRLVKRNADVLVQLLQSDEPEEVAVVKTALLKHLDMDPPITLGVLCDQIVPPEEDVDDYERQTRERLRSLVVSFLATDALGAIEKYTDPPGSEAEQVLVSQLILSISRLDTRDVETIVKDVLLSLPCYRQGYLRGNDLLQVLLDKATTALQARFNDPELLKSALFYLSLAQIVVVDKRAASPAKLLRFYMSTLSRKMALQKFSPEDRVTVISRIADALSASETEIGAQTQQVSQLRRQVVDSGSILLEILLDSKLYSRDLWHAVMSLLQAIDTRKELEKWAIPSHLMTSIRKFEVLANRATPEDTSKIQGLIRSLTGEQPSSSQGPTHWAKTMTNNGAILARPAHLPARPMTSSPPMSSQSDIPRPLSRLATQQPPRPDSTLVHARVDNILTSPKRPNSSLEDVPQSKRARTNSRGQTGSAPSLLSRLGDTGDPVTASSSERTGRKRGKRTPKEHSPEPNKHPSGGYSIKGAATVRRGGSSTETSPRPSSLLDRLRADEGGGRKRES